MLSSRFLRNAAALLAGLCTAAALAAPTLPTIELTAGMHRIQAEVADREETRRTGLMFRQSLAPNHGMLFVFERASTQCFWMRNTLVPLSIAFLADDGMVVNIADMAPLTENSHCSAQPVRFALEMEQGWFEQRGIKAGMRLRGLP
ncbi:DUF192 domain-containing protein [Orrella sp. JC864]|uniref:DUF192 domain-containing protein n=1 Tax=Orrella sp. JC864 TaxID=3120298 RepID=UPI0012BD01F8